MVKIMDGLKRYKALFIVAICILFIASILFLFHPSSNNRKGIVYLKIKRKDVAVLSDQLDERRSQEIKQKIDAGEIKYSSLFTDYVF